MERRSIALVALTASALWYISCAAPAPMPSVPRDRQEELYAQLLAEQRRGHPQGVLERARELTAAAPGFERLDRVLLLAAEASSTLADYRGVIEFTRALSERFPGSPWIERAQLLEAYAYDQRGDYRRAADALCRLLARAPDSTLAARAREELESLVESRLGQGDLEELSRRYPGSLLTRDISLVMAQREYARGNYQQSYRLLSELLYKYPEHPQAMRIRRLLRMVTERLKAPRQVPGYVDAYRIGLVAPFTGDFSLYGLRFYRGAQMAAEEFNASAPHPVALVRADDRGDPIDGVRTTRRLVHEEGVSAILGGLLTVPTIAEAAEADAWGVPYLSTLAESERLSEIGRWVFQTKVPAEVEVAAVARFAADSLLLTRFAVLAPEFGERRELARFFVAEVRRFGGQVVAEEYYPSDATDFKAQLERIRLAAPEALFVPSPREDLLMILPQLRFYDLELQLLGLSDWNSEKLLQVSARQMEGAIFPEGSYQGRDPGRYAAFAEAYRERFREEPDPVVAAGYFGARLLLEGIARGYLGREDLRDYLAEALSAGAEAKMAEPGRVAIMTVRSGRVVDYGERP